MFSAGVTLGSGGSSVGLARRMCLAYDPDSSLSQLPRADPLGGIVIVTPVFYFRLTGVARVFKGDSDSTVSQRMYISKNVTSRFWAGESVK